MAEKAEFWGSRLQDHRRFKKQLVPPFQQLPGGVSQIYWTRDFLPEFLWIDALVQEFGKTAAVSVFRDFLRALDPLVPDGKEVLDGTVSSFRLVPQDLRQDFLRTYGGKANWAVTRPFSYVLTLYPGCPMAWLLQEPATETQSDAIDLVRAAVLRLLPGKDEHTSYVRALPISRYFEKGKIHIGVHMTELIEALKAYPEGDRAHVESFARSSHNGIMQHRAEENPDWMEWTRYFWNRNSELVTCRPRY
jgi:hypothetical protein